MNVVVVYGSAVDPGRPGRPGDIDIAYTGDREAAAPIVAQWANRRGLADLTVDWHPARTDYYGDIVLPAPCGQPGSYQILAGDPRVRWESEWGLSAYVRAYGDKPRRLRRELRRKGAWWRLSVIPDPDTEREYIEGLTALRNAVTKRPAARDVLARQWPDLFPRLLEEDPRPTEDGLRILWVGSPWAGGDQISIVLTAGGAARLQYGGREEAAPLLYPPN